MTTITQTVASKAVVAFVAIAMIFTMFATPAQAQTAEDLQAQIAQLLEQINALQSQLGQGGTNAGAAGVCPYTWTRDLTMGSTGDDVMKLQQFLNADADTRVAAEGAGSVGMETMYYGALTAAAVSKMQMKYMSEVLTPNGLMSGTGYFGPSSRAKANAVCATPAVTVPDTDEDDDATDEDDDTSAPVVLGGVGILSDFEMDEEEDEVEEGASDEVVATITAEANNGDIEVSRMYFTLSSDGGNDENDAYDAFEEVSLWVDGEKIASFDASDEDDYLDEDDGEFIFSNLGLILMEDEEVEILVAVSVNNTVRGSENLGSAEWTLEATEVRYFDADGVASNDSFTGESVTFDIVREGKDDDADIRSNSSSPDSATLLVEDGTRDSDVYTVHIFDIEVDRDSSDLELNDAFVWVTVSNPVGAATAINAADVIDEIMLTIDGVTEDGSVAAVSTGSSTNITAGNSARIGYVFEFDGVMLDGDTDYEAEVEMSFKGQRDGDSYANGVTIRTDVDAEEVGALWEVEGANADNVLTGSDSGKVHTLATVVPVITNTSFEVSQPNQTSNSGTISFEFNVEADGDDYQFNIADKADVNGATDDVRFTVQGPDGSIATASISRLSGDATSNGTGWLIADGDDATFVLDVDFSTVDAADNGTYRVFVDTVGGIEIDMTSGNLSLSN